MSRHTVRIANPEAGETHAVIGYDRMLGQYFVQVYGISDIREEVITREFDGAELSHAGLLLHLPEPLLLLLMREASGMVETNVWMDWREDPEHCAAHR